MGLRVNNPHSKKVHRIKDHQEEGFFVDRKMCLSVISESGTRVELSNPSPETRGQMQMDTNLSLSCFLMSKTNVMP